MENKKCNKTNPSPPCLEGMIEKDNGCCYIDKITKTQNSSCNNKNPAPPCKAGYEEKLTKKGANCCYKSKAIPKKVKQAEKAEKVKPICNNKNPAPPCVEGYEERLTKKGELCCYKSKTKAIPKEVKKAEKADKVKSICNSKNPAPPCIEGYEEKLTKKGELCCYKSKTKAIPKKTIKNTLKKNPLSSRKRKPLTLIKPVLTRKGVYDSKELCQKESKPTNEQPITNYKFTQIPHIFDQLYYHAGDWSDIEKYGLLPLKLEPGNTVSGKTDMEFSPLYDNYDIRAVSNSLKYVFYHLKKGILVVIRNNELETFLPFSNQSFQMTDDTFKQLYMDGDDQKSELPRYIKYKKEFETTTGELKTRKQKSMNYHKIKSQKKIQNKFNNKVNCDRTKWQVNNCMLRQKKYRNNCSSNPIPLKNEEGDHSTNVFKDMFEQLCKNQKVPDMEFIINVRDFPLLRHDLNEPYEHIFDTENKPLPSQYRNVQYCPILSQSKTDNFADVLMPTEDDWARVSDKFYLDDWETDNVCRSKKVNNTYPKWEERKPIVVFRGKVTGCGATYETNVRLKAALLGYENPSVLDVGVTNWNAGLKKHKGSPVSMLNPKNFPFDLKPFMNSDDKYKHKYILNLDGNVSAFRLGGELDSGSVVLLPKSKYSIWFSHLLKEWEHYVPVNEDLSNLLDMAEWCRTHDDECKKIATNAKDFYDKYLTKEGLLAYFKNTLTNLSSKRSTQFLPIVSNKQRDICVVSMFREDSTGIRTTQKEHFIEIITKILGPYCNLKIVIVEQSADGLGFNIGKLKNIGFDIVRKNLPNYSGHFIFTDIDMLPDTELIKHYLNIPNHPTALALRGTRYTASDNKEPTKHNPPFMGGVCSFSKDDFEKVNGYPNYFIGWGGEDEALRLRVKNSKLRLAYPKTGSVIDLETLKYSADKNDSNNKTDLKYKKDIIDKENKKWEKQHTDNKKAVWTTNGLSSLDYKQISKTIVNEHTEHYVVDILTTKDMETNPQFFEFDSQFQPNKAPIIMIDVIGI